MGFGAFFQALLNCFCGPSTEQRPQQPPQQPRPGHKPVLPVAVQPPSRPAQRPSKPVRPSPPVKTAEKNHENEYYQDLRTRAKNEGAEMARCFEESHAAYARKDGARAKELSIEGKAHQREMERLNAQASEWIFNENNKDREPGEVDLHGLFVKEALTFTERAINDARRRGTNKIHLIVGKGLHSSNGVAKLKPAIGELMQKQGLIAELDQNNSGVLIVNLDGHPSGEGAIVQPEDITRSLEGKGTGCLIM